MKITGGGHTLEIDNNGRYSLSHDRTGFGFTGAGIGFDGTNVKTEALENGALVEYDGPGPKARLRFFVADEGVFIHMGVHNGGPLSLVSPFTLKTGEGNLNLTDNLSRLRFMRMGYSSWSPSGSWSITEKEPYPPLQLIANGGFHPQIGFKPGAGLHHADTATVITDPETGASLLIGFVTAKRYLSAIKIVFDGANNLSITASCDMENTAARNDESSRECETLMVAFGDDPHELWERYLDVAGEKMNARVPDKVPSGWCSWYHYFVMISEKTARSNLDALKKMKGEIEVGKFQIDDGYCVVGDWLEWNDKFPSGPEKLAEDIAAAGYTPGIWLAPFICSRGSRVFKEHRDWILKGFNGKPKLVGINPLWKGRVFYALDLTNPDAMDYVGRVMKQVREWGYRYVKIDFVYAALLRGMRHDPSKTGLQAYREGLETIRNSLGDDIFLLGCGAPMLPSVGYVDGMRVSADVAQYWRLWLTRAVSRAAIDPAAENSIHGTICRSAMHRKLWINDPDCLLVRKSKSRLTLDEIRTLATAIFMSGGMLLISDDMAALDPDRWEIIRACLPVMGEAARPADLFQKNDPAVYHLKMQDDKGHLLALINWSDKPAKLELNPAKTGLGGQYHAFEYWTRRYHGVIGVTGKDTWQFPETIPPHGSALIRLTPVSDEPAVIGTSTHMSMGGMDVTGAKMEGDTLRVSMALPGRRAGEVHIFMPGRADGEGHIFKEVEFKDTCEFEICGQ